MPSFSLLHSLAILAGGTWEGASVATKGEAKGVLKQTWIKSIQGQATCYSVVPIASPTWLPWYLSVGEGSFKPCGDKEHFFWRLIFSRAPANKIISSGARLICGCQRDSHSIQGRNEHTYASFCCQVCILDSGNTELWLNSTVGEET